MKEKEKLKKENLEEEKQEEEKPDKEKIQLGIIACIVFLLLLLSVTVKNVCTCLPTWLLIVLDIIVALGASGIAGLLVAMLVDTPQLVTGFKKTLTQALASNDYLENLPNEKLEALRRKIVGLIHKDSMNVPPSFLQLDDDLCGFIDAPYYEYFEESIVVGKKKLYGEILKEDGVEESKIPTVTGDFFKKDVQIDYQIKNPSQNPIFAFIGLSKSLDLPLNCNLENSYVFKSFEVTIDDGETYDIRNALMIDRCRVLPGRVGSDPNTMTYDTVVRMSIRNGIELNSEAIRHLDVEEGIHYDCYEFDTKKDVKVSFCDNVRVRIRYSQIFPIADSHYTRRLKYSAKGYMLSYTCQDDYVLHGQILGTLIKQSDMSIIKNNDNSITLICRNWLLPKNGAFIVMDDKVRV